MSELDTSPESDFDLDTEVRCVNLVATAKLNVEVDLKHLALNMKNASYAPRRFPAVNLRMKSPRATV